MRRKPYSPFLVSILLSFFFVTAAGADDALHAKNTAPGELRSLGKCLDVFESNPDDGTRVVLWECTGNANQRWRFVGGGILKQIVGLGDKCLVPGEMDASGNREVAIGPCDGSLDDLWSISGAFPGSISLIHNATGLCLDVMGSETANGTPILLFQCLGDPNQVWSFVVGAPTLPALLLPYYVVDRSSNFAPNTLFAVRNGEDEAVTIRFDFYDAGQDLGSPARTDVIRVGAKGVRTVNLRLTPDLPTDPITNLSTGYAGITQVDPDTLLPTAEQDLSGDFFRLDDLGNFASGDVLVSTDAARQPQELCNRWDLRFLNGGPFTGGTAFTFWVQNQTAGATPVVTGKVYDEAGNFIQDISLSRSANAFEVSAFGLGLGTAFGAIEWTFADGALGHVAGVFRASSRFSVGMVAICKD